ncbi:hypothetical protein DH2020_039139 [Rehmannia glutinosa]|uniref:Uncharacterized protein n=1 Tax=Rehmannia glutinosa TaxID=99300 RepID=A0ABR0UXU5_REHGL
MLCFLIFLYRSSPFVFSLLVSCSPVLICTAILLGTLLSFGQPNIPEIEIEEKTTYEAVSIRTGVVSRDAIVVEQNESYYVERYSDKSDGNEPSLSESRRGEICSEGSSNDGAPSVEEKSRAKLNRRTTVILNSPDSPRSPWKHVEEDKEEKDDEEDDDDAIDSESDGAESSSPDASMADIMPMLDELHPLLDEESSHPVQMSRNDSDAESEQSPRHSSSSSSESVDEIENHEDFVEDDDNEDDEDVQGDKEEQTKSAIVWTEEDQKNLMDLGSSELERNQRLENLILRRTRKHVSMVPEINLIDLESSDFPPHIAPISTTRQNPFDLPDSYDNIPGSAPSILLQRRNPFEMPYDSSQERPNPMGDGFQEELAALQSREPFFKRHESFNVGPSVFGPNRQDIKMRPYFVPERAVPEESSYSPFHRQSSELSDSKVSSIPETESVGSVEDLDEQKLLEEDSPQSPSEDQEMILPKEPQLISEINHVSEHIGHGSQSSDEEDRGSSSSSMSEQSSILDERKNVATEETDVSTQTSVESGDLNIKSTSVDDVSHKEPVYDSSPPAVRKNLSSSSISSDVHVDSNPSLPPVVVKRTVSFVERDSENREIEKEIPSDTEILSEPSMAHHANENESAREHDDINSGPSKSEDEKDLVVDKGETVTSPISDADYHEANERLMSTPSAGGSTPLFYDIAMHEPNFEHHEEVPVPNTPVESHEKVRTIQNLNIPEIYELDHDTSSSINSPFSPDFISMPSSSSASEEASSHVDMQTILEEADEIKEIDEGLLKLVFADRAETSTTEVVEVVNSVEVNEIENPTHLENSRDEIDVYDEDMKCIEPQISQNNSDEHIDTPNREFDEKNGQDSTVERRSEEETLSEENEAKTANSELNHNYQDNDSLPEEAESTSVETEVAVERAEVSHNDQVYMETASGMPELEARTREDIDVVFKQFRDEEIEKPVISEPPQVELTSESKMKWISNLPKMLILCLRKLD